MTRIAEFCEQEECKQSGVCAAAAQGQPELCAASVDEAKFDQFRREEEQAGETVEKACLSKSLAEKNS